MSKTTIVSPELTIHGVSQTDLEALLQLASDRLPLDRWTKYSDGGSWKAIQAGSGEVVDLPGADATDDRASSGIVFSEEDKQAFCDRFYGIDDTDALMRVANYVAPVITNLHADVTGFDYQPGFGQRGKRIVDIAGRFLPKKKGIAVAIEITESQWLGLCLMFDRNRCVETIIGGADWPSDTLAVAPLRNLKQLGQDIEIGVRINHDGFTKLLQKGLSRPDYAHLFSAGSIQLDPLPLPLKIALKASRIL